MSRTAGAASALLAALALVAGGPVAAAPKGAAANRLPYDLAVVARWGANAGSEAFRQDLARAVEDEFVERCVYRVVDAGNDVESARSDLILTIVLANAVDETRFDQAIGDALKPGDPANELRKTAVFSVDVDAQIATRAGRRAIRAHHLHEEASRRPIVIGEDPQESARREAIDRIAMDLRKHLCGSSSAQRSIREAMAAEPPAPPALPSPSPSR